MASIKLNSKRHETKSEMIKRQNTLKDVANMDKSALKPSNNLKSFGSRMFKAIVKTNKQLNSSDNATVNILCHEYDIYNDCLNYLNKNGLLDSKGRKSSYYSILKQTVDEILKLNNQLDLSPKTRISADFKHDQDDTDPVARALGRGEND